MHAATTALRAATVLIAASLVAPTQAHARHVRSSGAGTTAASLAPSVTYRTKKVASVPGAVRVVERSALDPFVYVVSRKGTVTRMRRDGSGRRKVLDVGTLTTTDSERGLLGLAFRRSGASWRSRSRWRTSRGSSGTSPN